MIPECDVTNVNIFFEGTSEAVDVYLDEVVVSPPGENLVANGGFEAGISGWTNGGWTSSLLEQSSTVVHSGSYSLRVYNRDSVEDNAVYNLNGLLESGTTYSVRAWIYADDASVTNTPAKLTAKIQCSGDDEVYSAVAEYTAESPMPAGEWIELSGEIVVPACELSDSLIFAENVTENVDFYLDDVSVMAN